MLSLNFKNILCKYITDDLHESPRKEYISEKGWRTNMWAGREAFLDTHAQDMLVTRLHEFFDGHVSEPTPNIKLRFFVKDCFKITLTTAGFEDFFPLELALGGGMIHRLPSIDSSVDVSFIDVREMDGKIKLFNDFTMDDIEEFFLLYEIKRS